MGGSSEKLNEEEDDGFMEEEEKEKEEAEEEEGEGEEEKCGERGAQGVVSLHQVCSRIAFGNCTCAWITWALIPFLAW